MEFESTEKKAPPPSRIVVVYDPRDGRIVHGHVFVGQGSGLFGLEGKAAREHETLDGARRNHGDISRLEVFHVPESFPFARNVVYRVDARARRLVEDKTVSLDKRRPKAAPAKRKKTTKTTTTTTKPRA